MRAEGGHGWIQCEPVFTRNFSAPWSPEKRNEYGVASRAGRARRGTVQGDVVDGRRNVPVLVWCFVLD